MAGGEVVIFKAELPAAIDEQSEFNFGIALHTGIGSPTSGIFRAEIIQNPDLIFAPDINHIKRDTELVSDGGRLTYFLLFVITKTGKTKVVALCPSQILARDRRWLNS